MSTPDMKFLFALADDLQMKLDLTDDGRVTGKVKGQIPLGTLTVGMPLEVVSSLIEWDRGAALLLRGPGDFGMLAEYFAMGRKLFLYVIDQSVSGKLDLYFEERKGKKLADVEQELKGAITCGFKREGTSTRWTRMAWKAKKPKDADTPQPQSPAPEAIGASKDTISEAAPC